MAITDKCKDPALAIAWYDYMLGFEVMMDGYIGPKGEAWTEPDSGKLGLNGQPAVYKLLTNFGGQRVNGGWNQANPMVRNSKFRLGEQAIDVDVAQKWWQTGDPSLRDRLVTLGSYNEETNFYFANQDRAWTIPATYFVPPYAPSDTDNARLADIEADLKPYLETSWVEFATGIRDINSDTVWNAYLTELDRLGAGEKAAIIQKYVK
jgi:putative aldouronate transport system substrate-binding protein